jgi:hypothetical protein
LGDRRILLREIELLRLIFKSQCLSDPIVQYANQELTIELIKEIEESRMELKPNSRLINRYVGSDESSSSSSEGKNNSKSEKLIEKKESKMEKSGKESRIQEAKKNSIKGDKMSIQCKSISMQLRYRSIWRSEASS